MHWISIVSVSVANLFLIADVITGSTKKVMAHSRVKTSEILGIVYTTQAMGIIPLGRDHDTLMNNITWVDGRAEKQAKKLMNRFAGKAAFKSFVGIELTGKDVIPKLMWLKEERKELYQVGIDNKVEIIDVAARHDLSLKLGYTHH